MPGRAGDPARGIYHFAVANPLASGMGTRDWNGEGYLLCRPYVEGAQIDYPDEDWVFRRHPEARGRTPGPVNTGRRWGDCSQDSRRIGS